MLIYTENGKEKKIKVGDDAILFQEKAGASGFSLLYNTWRGIKKDTYESRVLHDLIYYLRKGNFTPQGKNLTEDIRQESLVLPDVIADKNISGSTTALGATIYLINRLKQNNDKDPAIPVLLNILAGMANTSFFTKKYPNIEYKK